MKKEPINLFISYGHEEKNAEIIRRIVDYLSFHKFKLWIDKRNIPNHSDWRRKIVEGINNTDMTLGLLSQYSTRERGPCLDELAISISVPGRKIITILLDKEKSINIPSTVTREQWSDLSDWEEYIDTANWEDYFNSRMDDIIRAISSEENHIFQGEITTLKKVLKPLYFDKLALKYIDESITIERLWLNDEIEKWRRSSDAGRFLFLFGTPGTGKSHFASHYQHYNPICAAGVFCEYSKVNQTYVKDIVRTLSYTLATKYSDYRYALILRLKEEGLISENGKVYEHRSADFFLRENAITLFDKLLNIDTIGGYDEDYVIVIDGLDEVTNDSGNALLDFLCSEIIDRMPKHFRFVVTSRPEPIIMTKIEKLKPQIIDLNDEKSRCDISDYVRAKLHELELREELSDNDIVVLVEKCESMFLFAELICDSILKNELSITSIENLPNGIGGLYCHYFDRLFSNGNEYEIVKPFLQVITAFDTGFLSEILLARILGKSADDINRFHNIMRSFSKRIVNSGEICVSLFHKSLFDWLIDSKKSGKYFIDPLIGEKEIISYCNEAIEISGDDICFEEKKSIYFFMLKHKPTMLNELFLLSIQQSAYEKSEGEVFWAVTERIERMAKWSNNPDEIECYLISQVRLTDWLFDVDYEFQKAIDMLDQICQDPKFSEIMSKRPLAYFSVKISELYYIKQYEHKYNEALVLADNLIKYLQNLSDSEIADRKMKIARTLYHKGGILYSKGDYKECLETCKEAEYLSEVACDDPRKLQHLICIIAGSCLKKLGVYEDGIVMIKRSLQYRLALYGQNSLFVANAYINLISILIEKAFSNMSELEQEVYCYLEKYREILITNNVDRKRITKYWYYMAKISEYNGDLKNACTYADMFIKFKGNGDNIFENIHSSEMMQIAMKYS